MRPDEHLRQGAMAHQAGRLPDAENHYRMALALDGNNFAAARLLGTLYLQREQFDLAEKTLAVATKLNPQDPGTQQNYAIALMALERPADAITACDRALRIDPNYADCWQMRGDALYQTDAFANALESYDRVLALQPQRFEALYHRAAALTAMNKLDDAIAAFDKALAVNPTSAEAFRDRGDAAHNAKRFVESLSSYERALALRPDFPEALNGNGRALLMMARPAEALAFFDRTLTLKPDYADALKNRGMAYNLMGRWTAALADYDRALQVAPGDAADHVFKAYLLQHLSRMADAATEFDKAWALNPDEDHLAGGRLNAKLHSCDWRDFAADSADLLARATAGKIIGTTMPLLAIGSTPAQQLAAARNYLKGVLLPVEKIPRPRKDHDRIRLAYLSSDFRSHPVAMLILELFERHDRARFEVIAISLGPDDRSAYRARAEKAFDHFVDARDLTDGDIAALIVEMEVDILVDLNGHTQGARLGILARKAAPVQVNYLGYPGTIGADFMDYIIADRILVPVAEEVFYSEKIAALPVTYLPGTSKPMGETPTRAQCGLPEKGFVFCAFNNAFKITPDVFDIWMRLLQQIEGSILWLRGPSDLARANLQREAQSRGVAAERLIFAPHVEKPEDHLARHRLADIFLDTLYYNAHTTASDALWCGLPVVTCRGKSFAGRVGTSLLAAIDLPELITESPQEYENLARDLARDPVRLAALKQKLADNRTRAPLFDIARFTHDIEQAYQTMWQRSQADQKPESFTVENRR